MDGFVRGEWTFHEAIHTEPIFCDLREKKEQDLQIWLETKSPQLRKNQSTIWACCKFSITRDDETQCLEHYFNQRDPAVFNINNEEAVNATFNHFIDEVKGEIEAWSQGGSGLVVQKNFGRIFWCCTIRWAISRRKLHGPPRKAAKQESNN